MNIYTLLHNDHEKVKALFLQLEDTTEKALKSRERLFPLLKAELTVHAEAEEKFFYSQLVNPKEVRSTTMEALEEHKVVKSLLEQLESDPKGTEEWTAKLKVLQENVEHHVKEEETELFPQAKKILTSEQSQSIANEVELFKETQLELAPKA